MKTPAIASVVLAAAISGCAAVPSSPSALPNAPVPQLHAPLTIETPLMADTFVDALGVNTHMLWQHLDNPLMIRRMREARIRHIRDGIFPEETRGQLAQERRFLAATGAMMDGAVDCPKPLGYYRGAQTPPPVLVAFDAAIGGRMENIEGPNEPDLRNVADWPALTAACIARDDHALNLPFVASAMGDPFNARLLGNISSLVQIGAIHRYFGGFNPGTDGFWKHDRCGEWEAMSTDVCEARINAGKTAPIYMTETGWSTFGTVDAKIDDSTEGTYISRVLFVDSLAGIARTYLYELRDDGSNPSVDEDGYGLLRADGSPKPSFRAVCAETALLNDPGPVFSPTPLAYGLRAPATVWHELFQKRNGTYVLAVWKEVQSWAPYGDRPIAVASSPVTVTLAHAPVLMRAVSLGNDGRAAAAPAQRHGARITLSVDDRMTFFEFSFTRS